MLGSGIPVAATTVELVTFIDEKMNLRQGFGTIFVYRIGAGSACGVGPGCGGGELAARTRETQRIAGAQFEDAR